MAKDNTTGNQEVESSESKLSYLIVEGEAISQDSGSSMMLPASHRLRGEENYAQWKYDIENIARVHDLRRYYHPKAPVPPKIIDEFDDGASAEEVQTYKI